MCLRKLNKTKPSKNGVGYKWFKSYSTAYESPFQYNRYKPRKWYAADTSHVIVLSYYNYTAYQSGFHILKKKPSKKDIDNLLSYNPHYILVEVEYKDATVHGLDVTVSINPVPCVVAGKMRILRKVKT